ncbi:MAG: arsenate reductase ArsC [Desulfobulbaceae bacterium]|nr:arsenate reductase ArsC [Desulfobulbaceae bacterium]
MDAADKYTVLFLCTGNACRSQMAEGWAKHFGGEAVAVYSAGLARHTVDPRAIAVMAEAGVNIAGQNSKLIDELPLERFDFVVTLCDHANEECPYFAGGGRRLHRAFDDPPRLAAGAADEEEALAPYRRVRDEIRSFVEKFMAGVVGR